MSTSDQFGNIKEDTHSGETAEKMQEASSAAYEKGKGLAKDLGQQLHATAKDVGQQMQDAAKNIGEKARQSVAHLNDDADRAISGVGHRFKDAAQNLRRSVPQQGPMGTAAVAIADNLEAGGDYLEKNGLGDMMADLTTLIRKHPMQAMFITLTTGFLVGTAIKRR